MLPKLILAIVLGTWIQRTAAQDSIAIQVPGKYLQVVSHKSQQLEQKLDHKVDKALAAWQRQESRIQGKLSKLDPEKTKAMAERSQQAYRQLQEKLNDKAAKLKQYIPSLDTLTTSLKFLQLNPQLLTTAKESQEKLRDAMEKVKGLKDQFRKADEVKKYLQERKQYLKDQLQGIGGGQMAKELKKLNKQVYYYSQQVNEYKAMLKDRKKAEKKALALLSESKPFKDFMRKNSELASLFRLPVDPTGSANLAGLQTRSQVNGIIQQQLSAGGTNAQQQFQQNMQQAQSQLNDLKNKIAKAGASGSEDILPEGFKPNDQKTKSFLKRLEYGLNIQSQKANGFFPVTSDIGLTVGYKLNDKSILGIGGSYKMGWGQNIRNIRMTNQGGSFRSFIDWKIKGSFWVSGGYELNYRPGLKDSVVTVAAGKELNLWQRSGLIGISKQVSLKSKILKKTKVQLLWDFLSYQQVPRSQPVLFRVGYSF